MPCPFQIINIRTRLGLDMDPKNYGYFMGVLIIDPNRSGPVKNRSEPDPKFSNYLLNLNIQDPKDPDPKKTGPNPTRRPERPGLVPP